MRNLGEDSIGETVWGPDEVKEGEMVSLSDEILKQRGQGIDELEQENATLKKRLEELDKQVDYLISQAQSWKQKCETYEKDFYSAKYEYITNTQKMKHELTERAEKAEDDLAHSQKQVRLLMVDWNKTEADLAKLREAVERHREMVRIGRLQSYPEDEELYKVLEEIKSF